MPFRFEWKDDSRRVICYIADGDWNWKNYHHAVRASTFTLSAVDHPVECLIDLRGSTRQTLPSGLNAHVRSFGKKAQANLSGRAVVIGMPPQGMASLQLDGENTLLTTDGFVRFVESASELEEVLQAWLANPPSD